MTNAHYCIKDDYKANPPPGMYVERHDAGETIWQPDVYTFAEFVASLTNEWARPSILDIGCGDGQKLALMHDRQPDWQYCGIDRGPNLAHCRDAFGDWGRWIDMDLETPDFEVLRKAMTRPTVAICSDVIEHLVDPLPLLAWVRELEAMTVVLSTPERDAMYGTAHAGPPSNLGHVREWNRAELVTLLEWQQLRVRHAGLTRSFDGGPLATQLVVL